MALSYTPGLKVLANTIVEKFRQLPLKGNVLVNLDDRVDAETIVASSSITGDASDDTILPDS